MKLLAAIASAAVALMVAGSAHAFGLRTHLYIADQVHADLADCNLSLPGGKVASPPDEVCKAIQDNRGAFLAGALGPDAFPDLLVGQTYVHPGTVDGLQAADWLERVLLEAKSDREIAFAYGQMIHASGDVFAHTYVNNYAGDVFEITARWGKEVEERHFLLEKYIDQRLDYEAPVETLDVPAELLVRTMVETSYLPSNITLTARDVAALLDPDERYKAALRIVGRKASAAAPASHMTAMWMAIKVADRSRQNALCNHALAEMRLVEAYTKWILAEAEARGVSAPRLPALAPANCPDDPAAAAADLERATAALEEAQRAPATLPWQDAPMNQRKAWLQSLDPERRKTLVDTEDAYNRAAETRERLATIDILSRQWADDVRQAAEAYMKASQTAAVIMVRNSEPIPPDAHRERSLLFPYKAWRICWFPVFRGGPAEAARATCRRIDDLGADQTLTEVALPAALGDTGWRKVFFSYVDFDQWLDEKIYDATLGLTAVVNPSLSGLLEAMLDPERISREDLDKAFRKGGDGQLRFECVSDWIDADLGLAPRPEHALDPAAACLTAAHDRQYFDPARFQPVVHAVTLGKLALLDRAGVRSLAASFDSSAQVAVGSGDGAYSIILDTVRSLDGSHQWQGFSLPPPRQKGLRRKEEVRSAGYPRVDTAGRWTIRLDDRVRDLPSERPGFPYYQSARLRRNVFARLFPTPFEGEILRRVEYGPELYPVRPCEGDPFRDDDARRGVVCRTFNETTPLPAWITEHQENGPAKGDRDKLAARLEALDKNRLAIKATLERTYAAVIDRCLGDPVEETFAGLRIPRLKGCFNLRSDVPVQTPK
jgi:hypothetical protein